MNALDKLLARIRAAELAAKVRPRHVHHQQKRTTARHSEHRKGDRR